MEWSAPIDIEAELSDLAEVEPMRRLQGNISWASRLVSKNSLIRSLHNTDTWEIGSSTEYLLIDDFNAFRIFEVEISGGKTVKILSFWKKASQVLELLWHLCNNLIKSFQAVHIHIQKLEGPAFWFFPLSHYQFSSSDIFQEIILDKF